MKDEGVTVEDDLQWFHAEDRIRETIVGIVAGMALGAEGVKSDLPIIGFGNKNDEEVKVSARGTPALVNRGLDLSAVMGAASQAVGGDGGGHTVAAGATVPKGEERAFLDAAGEEIAAQLD